MFKGFLGNLLGLQTNALWRYMAAKTNAKTPPKMEVNFGLKTLIFGGQVGLHLEGVLATRVPP